VSIIERAAALLGSTTQGKRAHPAAGGGAGRSGEDLIERAVGHIDRVRDGSGRKIPEKAIRAFAVDRDRLRRQSMIAPDGGRTPIAESFRRVKRQILANVANPKSITPPPNLVMVTSALAGEGKTFCAINLAISLALEVDRSVLLVDADVAKSDVPKALGLEAGKGLMDLLLDRHTDLADVLWRTDIGRLTLLTVGTAHKHATELLASDTMSALLREMSERYRDRIIIFDSPPLLAASEAGVLAGQMGQIVLVVEAARTTETALKDALARIDSSRVTGLLLNKGQSASLEYGYGSYG
jgi:protein-tyrosine kinase